MKEVQIMALLNFNREFEEKIPDNSITGLIQITDIIKELTTKKLNPRVAARILTARNEDRPDQNPPPDDVGMGFGKKRSKRKKRKKNKSKKRRKSKRKVK